MTDRLSLITIAALIVTQYQDFAYTGVTVWALVAIAVKHWQNSLLTSLALIFAIALVAMIIINSVKPQRPRT